MKILCKNEKAKKKNERKKVLYGDRWAIYDG